MIAVHVQRSLYGAGLFLWVAFALLHPPWLGVSYRPDPSDPTGWSRTVFGLRGERDRAPLWDPPRPPSEDYEATVRWPWQAIHHGRPLPGSRAVLSVHKGPDGAAVWVERGGSADHIEVSVPGVVLEISRGILWVGLIVGLAVWPSNAWVGRREWDPVLWVGWSVSLGLVISRILLFGFAGLTAGYGPSEVGWIILAGGYLGGLLYGIASLRRRGGAGRDRPRAGS